MENNQSKPTEIEVGTTETMQPKRRGCGMKTWILIIIASIAVAFAIRLADNTKSKSETKISDQELPFNLDYVKTDNDAYQVVDRWSRDIILDNISWLTYEEKEENGAIDSIAAYSIKDRRGYLNLRQRKASLLSEQIIKAYLYSEGRAMAESNDSLYIFDTGQREIARFSKTGERDTEVNTFHKGYLPMLGDNGKLGLIDYNGKWALAPEYDKISWALDEFWLGIRQPVMVDEETGKEIPPHRIVKDSKLRTIMEGDWNYLMVTRDGYITVADRNHWQWHYDLHGNIIDDFVCNEILQMTYNTGEKRWISQKSLDGTETSMTQVDVEEYANLLKYVTSENWEGLMTKEGKIVTPPIFWSIEAINKNLYLCKYDTSSSHGILLNERGERVTTKH